jgi:hypothetical protein
MLPPVRESSEFFSSDMESRFVEMHDKRVFSIRRIDSTYEFIINPELAIVTFWIFESVILTVDEIRPNMLEFSFPLSFKFLTSNFSRNTTD